MKVRPQVVDLGWGELKTAIVAMKDPPLLAQYVDAFRKAEAGKDDQASRALKDIGEKHTTLNTLIDAQRAKLS